jgi:hypothetical protein
VPAVQLIGWHIVGKYYFDKEKLGNKPSQPIWKGSSYHGHAHDRPDAFCSGLRLAVYRHPEPISELSARRCNPVTRYISANVCAKLHEHQGHVKYLTATWILIDRTCLLSHQFQPRIHHYTHAKVIYCLIDLGHIFTVIQHLENKMQYKHNPVFHYNNYYMYYQSTRSCAVLSSCFAIPASVRCTQTVWWAAEL